MSITDKERESMNLVKEQVVKAIDDADALIFASVDKDGKVSNCILGSKVETAGLGVVLKEYAHEMQVDELRSHILTEALSKINAENESQETKETH